MFTIEFWIGALWMLVTVILYTWVNNKFFHEGVLDIDRSNPTTDKWRLHVKIEPETLYKKKYIVLKVDTNADLSHE